jgi:hypothetical protein
MKDFSIFFKGLAFDPSSARLTVGPQLVLHLLRFSDLFQSFSKGLGPFSFNESFCPLGNKMLFLLSFGTWNTQPLAHSLCFPETSKYFRLEYFLKIFLRTPCTFSVQTLHLPSPELEISQTSKGLDPLFFF